MADHSVRNTGRHKNRPNRNFIKLTYSDVKNLSYRKNSCISEIHHKMKLPMSPKYITNIRLGLKESLRKELFVYNSQMKGIPLAFDKIQVIKSTIVDDQDFIMLAINVVFLVFNPVVGKLLCGTINKIGDHHLGCIIHDCINGSIRYPRDEYLTEEQKDIVKNIAVGNEVIFKVNKLDVHHDILFILGDIAHQFYQHVRQNSMKNDTGDLNNNANGYCKSDDEKGEEHMKKKKKKMKHKEKSNMVNGQDTNNIMKRKRTDSSSQSESPSKKKKKKVKEKE